MNGSSQTLALPGVHGASSPVREIGSSALDHRPTWAAPDPSTMLFDPWGAPVASTVIRIDSSPWDAPDPLMRFDLPAPIALGGLVEPRHSVLMPDIEAARRDALDLWSVPASTAPFGRPLPPPTLADAAPAPAAWTVRSHRRRGRRVAVGLAAAAGVACAAAAAAVAYL